MTNLKVTVTNPYLPTVTETFYCFHIDISDLEELEMAADECCGQYLDMHGDAIHATCPDIPWETLAEACEYVVEETKEVEI